MPALRLPPRFSVTRWEPRGTGADFHYKEIKVDWRSALSDALLSVDCHTSKIIAEFEQLCLDPAYEENR